MRQWVNDKHTALYTYPLEAFEDLKQLFAIVPQFLRTSPVNISALPCSMQDYLLHNNYIEHISQINANSASPEAFVKRFFGWFDGLKTVKYLNDCCRQAYNKQCTVKEANRLLQKLGYEETLPTKDLLNTYRKIERI
jgi:hypothetical protein